MLTHLSYRKENLPELLEAMTPQSQKEQMMETLSDLLLLVPREDMISVSLSTALTAHSGIHQTVAELLHDLNSRYMVPCSVIDPNIADPAINDDEIYVYVTYNTEDGIDIEPIGFKLTVGH